MSIKHSVAGATTNYDFSCLNNRSDDFIKLTAEDVIKIIINTKDIKDVDIYLWKYNLLRIATLCLRSHVSINEILELLPHLRGKQIMTQTFESLFRKVPFYTYELVPIEIFDTRLRNRKLGGLCLFEGKIDIDHPFVEK